MNTILVVGGGIGGLTLAAALKKRGVAVEVWERAPQFKPLGAGIVMSINAMAVLRGLGLGTLAEEKGWTVHQLDVTDETGRVLSGIDITGIASVHGESVALHRAALHEVLLHGCDGVTIRPGTTAEDIRQDGDRVRVKDNHGGEQEFSLVVGADGLHSQVRTLVFGRIPTRYSGYTCWRAVVPFDVGNSHRSVEMWGRGKRVGLVPISKDRVYMFTTLNAPAGMADPVEGRLERFRERFAEFGDLAPAIIRAVRQPEALLHHDLEQIEVAPWVKGRVVLLGDAAHAMTPNMGQGAAMAIEDAAVLSRLIAEQGITDESLARYEALRRPRVHTIQSTSWRLGRVAQWQNAMACRVRNAMFAAMPDSMTLRQLARVIEQGTQVV
ncbi:MAG: FAD-dependent monooxygenase [Myxococcota bacterium]